MKRLLSNFIDFVLFLITYLSLGFCSKLEWSDDNMAYILFVSFLLYFVIPLIFNNNTFGKLIVGLKWKNTENYKLSLFLKYTFYFLTFAPKFSFFSLFAGIPFFKTSGYDKLFSLQFLFSFIVLDIIIFLFSFGKYHLLDYAFNLQLNNSEYKKNELESLSFILFFLGMIFLVNITCFRFNLSFQNINNTVSKNIYTEQFPSDKFYGSRPLVVKQKSSKVFLPTDMFSFLFEKEYEQKSIYLNLPTSIFNSEIERIKICQDLMLQSATNDVFSDFKPKQTKIILTTIEEGHFFDYTTYYYIYYFNNELPCWGVNGGIKADSTIVRNYVDFVYGILEDNSKEFNKLSSKELQKKKFFSTSLQSSTYCDKIVISSNKNKIEFKKIDFKDVKLQGNVQLNFPVQSMAYRVNYFNIIGDELIEYDDNIFYLTFARKEISNKEL